jgi:exosortase/archaeosortase family protein
MAISIKKLANAAPMPFRMGLSRPFDRLRANGGALQTSDGVIKSKNGAIKTNGEVITEEDSAVEASGRTLSVTCQAWQRHARERLAHFELSLIRTPAFVRYGIAIDRASAWAWLALLAAALWPTGWWMGARMLDRSDDPLGLLALAALCALVWQHRHRLRAAPRLGWFALAVAGALAATAAQGLLPPLATALTGLLAFAAGLIAFLPWGVAMAPVLGLSVLSLPLLASLQFYAGYPLRIVTAEASRWLLMATHEVERSGTSLNVDGRLVIVDAPCSGVQMVWLGYFSACVVALYAGRRDRAFLTRLPAVGMLVLAGNIVRNTVLVAFEASGHHLPGWAHDGVGLVVLAAVCGAIAWVMNRRDSAVGGSHV